jgi:hypothetical protein
MKRGISDWVILRTFLFTVFVGLSVSTQSSAANRSAVEDFVTRFYQSCLDRAPDQAGLDGWVSALIGGSLTGSDVAYGFVFSQEFLNKNVTNDEYLTVLYEAFFNRQPDSGGWQGWLDAIARGSSRQDVLNGFIFAVEFAELCDQYGIKAFEGHVTKEQRAVVEAFVTRFYQLFLERDPDSVGLQGWTNNLLNQIQTGADVAYGFMFSQEFLEKNTSNEDYLTILYEAFFDRQPDQAGWDIWLAELDGGKVRLFVLNRFIYSQEFSQLCKRFSISPFSDSHVGYDGDGNVGSWFQTGFKWPHDGNPFESVNCIIYSDGASSDSRQTLAQYAEEALSEIKHLFEIESNDIFLFPPGQEKIDIYTYKLRFPRGWGGWGYYGGFLIYSLDHPGRQELGHTEPKMHIPVIAHELTHVVQSLLIGDDSPSLIDVWLTEGLAEAVSGGTAEGRITNLDQMNKLRQKYGWSLNPIKMHLYEYPDVDWIIYDYYYPMFQLAVEYLVDVNGHGKSFNDIKNLFMDVSVGVPFPTAFKNRFGMSLLEYEVQFFDLMNNYLQ